ncbi:MAG: hypothetical protein H0X27_06300 [Caulobacteraceae bacterium]|nr:hypothetical protein [Caulobacteraceae bacterium]
MDDTLSFLPGEPEQAEEPTAPEPPIPPIQSGAGEPEPAPEPAKPLPEAGHVPISAMRNEREKRQKLERELATLREAQAPRDPPGPEAMQAALHAQNLRVSRKFAERQYGAETLAKVHDWAAARCDADPIFNQQMRSSDDPYEAAMQAFNRERVLETVKPDDLDAFLAWRTAQTAAPAIPANPSPPPPRSLATAPGNGAMGNRTPEPEVGEGVAFRSVIRS